MSIELTAAQQQVLAERQEFPPRVIDPSTSEIYVLLHAEMYERVRAFLEDEDEIASVRETYGVVSKVLDAAETESSSKESA
jgi:hypothetical protein